MTATYFLLAERILSVQRAALAKQLGGGGGTGGKRKASKRSATVNVAAASAEGDDDDVAEVSEAVVSDQGAKPVLVQ